MWAVYLLECADGSLYCGATNDLIRRVVAHNSGKGARYTRGRAPVRLRWSETFATKGDALRREIAVKRLTRAQKLRLATSEVQTAGARSPRDERPDRVPERRPLLP